MPSVDTTAIDSPIAVWGYGFRPFFLGSGIAAVLAVGMWILNLMYGVPLPGSWPPVLWHAHELLHGVLIAALAGFLLTAVPNWTGQNRLHGARLAGLTGLWVAGRLAISMAALLPPSLVALVDCAFLPVLALAIAKPLFATGHRNRMLLLVLAALFATQCVFHLALIRHDSPTALLAVHAALNLLLLLVTVIGGRIIPAFTTGALQRQGVAYAPRTVPYLGEAVVLLMILQGLAEPCGLSPGITALICALAGLAQGARLVLWRGPLKKMGPLTAVLHVVYALLPLGLLLKALAITTHSASTAFWWHLLTIGVLAGIVLAVMTRASLGHTGRSLVAAPSTVVAYALLLLAALLRVFGLAPLHLSYPLALGLAALAWISAFGLYLGVYAPILLRRRADGREG